MQLSRDRVRTSRRAAAIVIIAAALLAAAWAAPRSSEAVAAWLRPETVKTRGLAVADRLMVTAATSDGAAPGDARSATDAGSFGVAPQAVQAKTEGFKGYKIHPGGGQHPAGGPIPAYVGHIEEIREVRKAVGEEFTLLFDPVQRYNVF